MPKVSEWPQFFPARRPCCSSSSFMPSSATYSPVNVISESRRRIEVENDRTVGKMQILSSPAFVVETLAISVLPISQKSWRSAAQLPCLKYKSHPHKYSIFASLYVCQICTPIAWGVYHLAEVTKRRSVVKRLYDTKFRPMRRIATSSPDCAFQKTAMTMLQR